MAQERPTKKRGGITGRAYVVMSGKVALCTYNGLKANEYSVRPVSSFNPLTL